jgi:methyltransferase (TIGR00027 family)
MRGMFRRIESKTSRTAEYTCLTRCLSYLEKREQYRSGDYVSLVIMNSLIRLLLHIPAFQWRFRNAGPAGMYEYVIARTKYIDRAFEMAPERGIEQILIFGAGFDSRGVRFGEKARGIRIFELDAPATQEAKVQRYRRKGIGIPENLTFVPIDFDRESLEERLAQAGFQKDRRCLFILEGVTMYLQPSSVDGTFRSLRALSGEGSRVVFDCIHQSVLRRENLYEGEQALYDGVAMNGEGFHFGIERGKTGEFLSQYGFKAEEVLDAAALQDMFFRGASGKVNGTHCIVSAVKPAQGEEIGL